MSKQWCPILSLLICAGVPQKLQMRWLGVVGNVTVPQVFQSSVHTIKHPACVIHHSPGLSIRSAESERVDVPGEGWDVFRSKCVGDVSVTERYLFVRFSWCISKKRQKKLCILPLWKKDRSQQKRFVTTHLIDKVLESWRSVICHAPTTIYKLKLTILKQLFRRIARVLALLLPPAHEERNFHENEPTVGVFLQLLHYRVVNVSYLFLVVPFSQKHIELFSLFRLWHAGIARLVRTRESPANKTKRKKRK